MTTPTRSLPFYKADVFADAPFGGNPVAVIPDATDLTEREFQQIAREMNLSETVFVVPPTDPAAVVKLRIFTPTQEIPFAGHPVIGTFFVLSSLQKFPLTQPVTRYVFECNIGLFPVELHVVDGQVDNVFMTQPKPQFLGTAENMQDLYEVSRALGMNKTAITETHLPIEVVSTGLPVAIVPVRTLTAVKSTRVDPTGIKEVCDKLGANGIMVFTPVTVEEWADVHTRMFAAPIGIWEDPATGSASGALGAYLVKNGVVDVGPTTEVCMEQGYEIDRPSRITVQVFSDDDAIQEIKVGGQAVMIAEGKLLF
ncbi:MAG: PhzF family phenazine biosynthesis protein [Nitrospira sp. SB0673_bin_12]|nr:PhzF family phenazine biosynthesis protein [Nitrospira sp. SB0673_bin_12]